MKLRFPIYHSQFPGAAALFACFIAIFAASCSRQAQNAETVAINNVEPRRDINGQILDAHGGCLQFFEGRFYLYGTSFGTNHDDTVLNCPFVVYSSPDLKDWTFQGDLFKTSPTGVYYRPYVVFNPSTRKYVLWYNWYPKLWQGQTGVAESDSPVGPFVIVNRKARLSGTSPGDGSLFVDNDGTGYYIYTDIANDYALRVERLTSDFLDTSGKISNIMATGAEAPLLFRRNNLYYILCGPLCADASKGSEVQVFTSLLPLGPFSTKPAFNINRRYIENNTNIPVAGVASLGLARNGTKSAKGGWFSFRPETSIPIITAQETWVAKIPSGDESMFIWMGDRWQSAPDGTRGHDFQFWSAPLKFTDDGHILPLQNTAEWYITWSLQK